MPTSNQNSNIVLYAATSWLLTTLSRTSFIFGIFRASLIAQSVKNLPTMQETRVQFLSQKDPLEKEMAMQSSLHSCRTPFICFWLLWRKTPGFHRVLNLSQLDTEQNLLHPLRSSLTELFSLPWVGTTFLPSGLGIRCSLVPFEFGTTFLLVNSSFLPRMFP